MDVKIETPEQFERRLIETYKKTGQVTPYDVLSLLKIYHDNGWDIPHRALKMVAAAIAPTVKRNRLKKQEQKKRNGYCLNPQRWPGAAKASNQVC